MEMTGSFRPENKPGAVDLGLDASMMGPFVNVSVTCVVVVTIMARVNTAGAASRLGSLAPFTSEGEVAAVVPDNIGRSESVDGPSDLFSGTGLDLSLVITSSISSSLLRIRKLQK